MFSNSLGTAFGDYLTDAAGLSYVHGALVTAAVIGVVLALHSLTRIGETLLFWTAFVSRGRSGRRLATCSRSRSPRAG